MSKVISFSRTYPSYHSRKKEPTYFVEKIWEGKDAVPSIFTDELPIESLNFIDHRHNDQTKYTTIRNGNKWKVGDFFSPRVWGDNINLKSGRKGAYHSKQITFAPDTQIKKLWDFSIFQGNIFIKNNTGKQKIITSIDLPDNEFFAEIAKNDGLSSTDMLDWFKYPHPFSGQIICWNEKIDYDKYLK